MDLLSVANISVSAKILGRKIFGIDIVPYLVKPILLALRLDLDYSPAFISHQQAYISMGECCCARQMGMG